MLDVILSESLFTSEELGFSKGISFSDIVCWTDDFLFDFSVVEYVLCQFYPLEFQVEPEGYTNKLVVNYLHQI